MNKFLNERGEEQLSTTNRFHWLISAEQAGVLSCELQCLSPGQLRSSGQFENAFLEKPRARITAERGQSGIPIPKALHKPSTEKQQGTRQTPLAALSSQQPCCQMSKRIGLSRSTVQLPYRALLVEFAIFLNLVQALQEMKLKWLPNPFLVRKNSVGASSSF